MNSDLEVTISGISDLALKKRLEHALRYFDFRKIKNHEDFSKAYQGLADLILHDLISPKKGDLLLKALSGYAQHTKLYLEIDFPSQVIREFQRQLELRDQALRQILSPKDYQEYLDKISHVSIEEPTA